MKRALEVEDVPTSWRRRTRGFPEDEEDEDGESLDGGDAFSVCGGATPSPVCGSESTVGVPLRTISMLLSRAASRAARRSAPQCYIQAWQRGLEGRLCSLAEG